MEVDDLYIKQKKNALDERAFFFEDASFSTWE